MGKGIQKSCIDYGIVTQGLLQLIANVTIDEQGAYDIGSDHNTMVIIGHVEKVLPRC